MKSLLLSISLICSAAALSMVAPPPPPPIQCSKVVCPNNEVYSSSGSPCQETCYGNEVQENSLGCSIGNFCVCKKGYVRDPRTYKCILIKRCPVKETDTTCPANEEYTEDGAGCQHTCASKASGIQVKCMTKSGCRCKPGFLRNDVTGQCIREKSCPSELIVRS